MKVSSVRNTESEESPKQKKKKKKKKKTDTVACQNPNTLSGYLLRIETSLLGFRKFNRPKSCPRIVQAHCHKRGGDTVDNHYSAAAPQLQ